MNALFATAPTVGIIGVGYVGTATGLAFAHRGRQVFSYDVDLRVRAALRTGHSPHWEEGLEELLQAETHAGRFVVKDTMQEVAEAAECIFLCLPTPSGSGGRIDLGPLRAGIRELGTVLKEVDGFRLVVLKSTAVPGTTESVVEPLLRRTTGKGPDRLGVATNPEFLAEGRMLQGALSPDRVVIGTTDRRSADCLRAVYQGFSAPILELSPSEAELVKYASNTFLALKVSFANELSQWTERLGGDIDQVARAVGADRRIGPDFLRAGPGFGGSCFGKDLKALRHRAEELGLPASTAATALAINHEQTEHVYTLVRTAVGPLQDKTVALLGLAFKAGTDDVRDSRAFPIVERLLRAGASVRAHDPAALGNFRREWMRRFGPTHPRLTFCESAEHALRGADVAVLQADWPEYVDWPASWSASMHDPLLVDLRRALPVAASERAGLRVVALGVGIGIPGAARVAPIPPTPTGRPPEEVEA